MTTTDTPKQLAAALEEIERLKAERDEMFAARNTLQERYVALAYERDEAERKAGIYHQSSAAYASRMHEVSEVADKATRERDAARAEIERLKAEASLREAGRVRDAAEYRAEVERLKADRESVGQTWAGWYDEAHAYAVRLYRAAVGATWVMVADTPAHGALFAALNAAPESVKRDAEREDGAG